jgi:Fe(3+) dicitrate transport protein
MPCHRPTRPPRRARALVCALLGAGPALVLAEVLPSTPATRLDEVTLREITVTGGPGNIEAVPGSAHFIDADVINSQSYDDVQRLLQRVPGVYVRGEDALGIFPNISLRGVDTGRAAKVTLMEDGILIAPAPYSAPAAYFNPATARMSGVEVLMGSSQVRYGPHTTGGVINYISTPIPVQREGRVRAQFGDFADLRVHAYAGDTFDTDIGRIGLLVEGFGRRTDGFKTIDQTPDFRDGNNTGLSRDEPMIKLAWEPAGGPYQRFEFRYGQTDLDADETYLGLNESDFDQDPNRRYSSTRFDNIQARQQRYALRHLIAINDQVDLATTLYYNQFSRNWFKLHNIRNADGQSIGLSQALEDYRGGLGVLRGEAAGELRVRNNARDYESYGIGSVLNAIFATGDWQHELAAGLRWHYDEEDRDQIDQFFTQADNGTISDVRFGTPGGAGDRVQDVEAVALFVRDAITTGQWTFTPGIRAEWLDMAYHDRDTDTRGTGSLNMVGGGLGMIYRFSDHWNVFGGVHRGFSPPGPRAAIRGGLEEETSLAWELGSRYSSPNGAFFAQGTLFYTDFDNLIAIDNVGGTGSGDAQNLGEADNKGLELELGFDPGVANGWTFSMPSFVALTYSDAKLRSDSDSGAESIFSGARSGNRVPYIPEWQVSAGTSIERGPWAVSATLTYVGETYATGSNTSQQLDPEGIPDARFGKTDAYTIVDVQAGVDVTDNVNLFVGAHNLFDQEYVASRLPHGPRPGLPQFFYAGIDVVF